jgi:hypothetical protein
MSRHKLFRGHAAECIRLAETVKSDELRLILMTMAHGWHRLAQQWDTEGKPATIRTGASA